jgi:succinate-semialdehyde dehydrogenase/glutarate-semialdehyde dehydrogenase
MTSGYPEISLYVDGGWCKGADGKSLPVLNPATGDAIGSVPVATRADLDRALDAAAKGFKAWRKVSAYDRYKLMRKAADIVRGRADDIAKTMTLEQGKPFFVKSTVVNVENIGRSDVHVVKLDLKP